MNPIASTAVSTRDLLILVAVTACGAPSPPAKPSVAAVRPVASAAHSSAEAVGGAAPPAWSFVSRALPPIEVGVASEARLDDGRIVGVVSYASESEPVAFYSGNGRALKKRIPPWTCVASPAQLTVSGNSVWVCCGAPDSPEGDYWVHFWHSGDAGMTWTRAGVRQGLARAFAIAGDTLFVKGTFNKEEAVLHRVEVAGQTVKSRPTSSNVSPGIVERLESHNLHVVASNDGSNVVVVSTAQQASTRELVVLASTDGGAHLEESFRRPWPGDKRIGEPSLVGDSLTFPVDHVLDGPHHGKIAAVASFSLSSGNLTMRALSDPDDVCVHGRHVAARWGKSDVRLSSNGGVTFVETPLHGSSEPEGSLHCSAQGVTLGDHAIVWPGDR